MKALLAAALALGAVAAAPAARAQTVDYQRPDVGNGWYPERGSAAPADAEDEGEANYYPNRPEEGNGWYPARKTAPAPVAASASPGTAPAPAPMPAPQPQPVTQPMPQPDLRPVAPPQPVAVSQPLRSTQPAPAVAPQRVPAPQSAPRAVPALAGAPALRYNTSASKVVAVAPAPAPAPQSGVRVFRSSEASIAHPRPGLQQSVTAAPAAPPQQMKVVRLTPGPNATVTRYGTEVVVDPDAFRPKPKTIRVNP
ncbi:MAG TPA: hypothetical protein PLR76_02155 [Hyphomonas sp.]|nr:hypothetical protein [Hyphomonas sp.]MCA8903652.1 hypothetical protein [Hyphomonas sp.]MCB9961184.1 hypothetical protein [Hyphomonas sp.]MCB9970475.1 hypothetical protein [Hyphomonas sp.]HPE47163.1 hypothetical protein [Hyphomonas sp.]